MKHPRNHAIGSDEDEENYLKSSNFHFQDDILVDNIVVGHDARG